MADHVDMSQNHVDHGGTSLAIRRASSSEDPEPPNEAL
jgi:hypothetical protein